MKRAGNLYKDIADMENLRLAFWKAAKGKRGRQEVVAFSRDLETNLGQIRRQLLAHEPDIGHYRFFEVYDPKHREICAASFPERVLHHAVMNLCEPVLDRCAIFDSYACRKNKGNRKAIAKAKNFAGKNAYYLQLDIHKYFDSIYHEILLSLLGKRFKDSELMDLFDMILSTFHKTLGKGLPIGNLVSQHLANFYLSPLDRWVKEELRVRHYLRYMDDFLLFSSSRIQLKQNLSCIRKWLREHLQLELKNDIKLNRTRLGFTFLGFRIFPGLIRLSNRSKRRFSRKLRRYEENYQSGVWTQKRLIRHVEPLVDFTRIADAKGFRRKIIGFKGSAQGLEPG